MCKCKGKCNCKNYEIKLRGPRGFIGPQGPQGPQGGRTALESCPMFVEIINSPGRIIEAIVTGGVAPYTYTWSLADYYFSGVASMFVLAPDPSDPTNDAKKQPVDNPAVTIRFDSAGSANTGRVGLAKVIVTDANSCKVSDTHLLLFVGAS